MTTAASPSGRLRRIWRGPDTDPAWARPALFALLLATGAFYVIGLTSNGWANSFYSAADQAGSPAESVDNALTIRIVRASIPENAGGRPVGATIPSPPNGWNRTIGTT